MKMIKKNNYVQNFIPLEIVSDIYVLLFKKNISTPHSKTQQFQLSTCIWWFIVYPQS